MRSHILPGFVVGGIGLSPGSIVTCRAFGTLPPLGPRSIYSPDLAGFSPGLYLIPIVLLPSVFSRQHQRLARLQCLPAGLQYRL